MMSGDQFKSLFYLMFYKASLDLAYYLLGPLIEYYAIAELNLNISKLVESYFLTLLIFIAMPKSSSKLSNHMLWLLVLLSYIPMLTIFAFQDESRVFIYLTSAFWLEVFVLQRMMPSLKFRPLRESQAKAIFVGLVSVMCLLSIVVLYKSSLSISWVRSITQLYEHREAFVETLDPLERYPVYWVVYSISPILFSLSIVNRKWSFASAIVLIQILLGFVIGVKNALAILSLVAGLMFVVTRKNPLAWIEAGLAIIIWGALIAYYLFGNTMIYLLGTARALLVPAQLSFFYYDFFSTHGFIPFAYIFNFFLKIPVVNYPYDLPPSNLIGQVYYDSPGLAAVAGIVADAYMNLGPIGLILWAIALAMILKLVDSVSRGLDSRIRIAGVAMGASSITGTYLVRSMFTAGLVLSLLLLYLLRTSRATGKGLTGNGK